MKIFSISCQMPSSEFAAPRTRKRISVTLCTAISRIPLAFRSFPSDQKFLLSVSVIGFSSTPPTPCSTLLVSVPDQDTFAGRSLRTPSARACNSISPRTTSHHPSAPTYSCVAPLILIVYSLTLGELARNHIQNWPASSKYALCPLSRSSRCICTSLSIAPLNRLKKTSASVVSSHKSSSPYGRIQRAHAKHHKQTLAHNALQLLCKRSGRIDRSLTRVLHRTSVNMLKCAPLTTTSPSNNLLPATAAAVGLRTVLLAYRRRCLNIRPRSRQQQRPKGLSSPASATKPCRARISCILLVGFRSMGRPQPKSNMECASPVDRAEDTVTTPFSPSVVGAMPRNTI